MREGAIHKSAIGIVATLSLALAAGARSGELDEQRDLFRAVYPDVERGDWGAVESLDAAERELLEAYTLWPDLRAAWFRATIRAAEHGAIEAFLDEYGTLKPARELRYRYALHLAATGRLDDYLDIYEAFYQGLEIARLDCLALQAEMGQRRVKRLENRARQLWLTGRSQADECNPVFAALRERGLLTDDDYRARYELAIEAHEFTRARWLARSIDPALVAEAEDWLRARSQPTEFLTHHARYGRSDAGRRQLAYAIERVTYADPAEALARWREIAASYPFPPDVRDATLRHIALWTARDGLPGAYALLTELPAEAQDVDVLRWRARTSLRSQAWRNLLADIRAMPADERESEGWRYWNAVALGRSGDSESAILEFTLLARERSYYGFLAADAIGAGYRFADDRLTANESEIATLSMRADLIRARELFLVGLDGRGRSEWDAVVDYFSPEETVAAAVLAHRWGWHSRAIATAARTGQYDDLALRYPLPWQRTFEQYALKASIPTTWAYGIARSESLFMRDVRSRAGAVGLMQLMPSTGRRVARSLKLPYTGLNTLTDPDDNILLGTTYLGDMAQRYDGNRVLATAAYNAGPHRVDRWLPDSGGIDARIWIENIPFDETRGYVRRVMAAETIFQWRLTGSIRRLSDELPVVEPRPDTPQLAAR